MTAPPASTESPRHARRWFHFSLLLLPIVVLGVAVLFVWHRHDAEQRTMAHNARRLTFLEQLDLDATAKSLAPQETTWVGDNFSSGGELEYSSYNSVGVLVRLRGGEWDKSRTLQFQCDPENLETLVDSIGRELRTRFQNSGAQIHDEDVEPRLRGFTFEYSDGGVSGTVIGDFKTTQDSWHPHELIIAIHEGYVN